MGLLWRLFAPKDVKRARRAVHKVSHPVGAITPRPVKQVRRAAQMVTHPLEVAENAAENSIVHAVRGGGTRRSAGHSRSPHSASQESQLSNQDEPSEGVMEDLLRSSEDLLRSTELDRGLIQVLRNRIEAEEKFRNDLSAARSELAAAVEKAGAVEDVLKDATTDSAQVAIDALAGVIEAFADFGHRYSLALNALTPEIERFNAAQSDTAGQMEQHAAAMNERAEAIDERAAAIRRAAGHDNDP